MWFDGHRENGLDTDQHGLINTVKMGEKRLTRFDEHRKGLDIEQRDLMDTEENG